MRARARAARKRWSRPTSTWPSSCSATGRWNGPPRWRSPGMDEAIRRGVGGSDGAILAGNAAEALTRTGRLERGGTRSCSDGLDHHPPPAIASFLMLTGAELDVLRGRLPDGGSRAGRDRGARPGGRLPVPAAGAGGARLSSSSGTPGASDRPARGPANTVWARPSRQESASEDVPLTARLLWLAVCAPTPTRAAWPRSRSTMRGSASSVADGEGLRERAVGLSTGDLSDGVRRQLGALPGADRGRAVHG